MKTKLISLFTLIVAIGLFLAYFIFSFQTERFLDSESIVFKNGVKPLFNPSKIPRTKNNPAPRTAETIIQGFFIS